MANGFRNSGASYSLLHASSSVLRLFPITGSHPTRCAAFPLFAPSAPLHAFSATIKKLPFPVNSPSLNPDLLPSPLIAVLSRFLTRKSIIPNRDSTYIEMRMLDQQLGLHCQQPAGDPVVISPKSNQTSFTKISVSLLGSKVK